MMTSNNEYSEYEIYMKTIKVNKFKQLIEALKEILLDVNLNFTPEGIRIASVNVTETVLVSLKLTPDIGEFYCEKSRSLGINMGRFHQIIKTLNNNDILSIYVEKSERNVLVIYIENKIKQMTNRYKMNIFDPQKEVNNIPEELEYECIFNMPSGDFQRLCRNMDGFAKILDIKSADGVLYLSGKGDTTSLTTIIRPLSNAQDDDTVNFVVNSNPEDIIQGYFNLKELVLFNKCTNINKIVKLHLKNDEAFIISYTVGNFGELLLCVVPIDN